MRKKYFKQMSDFFNKKVCKTNKIWILLKCCTLWVGKNKYCNTVPTDEYTNTDKTPVYLLFYHSNYSFMNITYAT